MVNKCDKKKTGKLFSKKNDRLFIAAMLALPLLHFAVFTCYINISSLVMAFQDLDFTTNQEYFVGFGNFTRFFKEFTQVPSWKSAIKNSALYFPVTNFITLPLSLIAAYFLFRKVPLSGCYKIVFFFPSIISIVVLAMVYRNMLDPTTGPVCLLLKKLGMTDETVPLFLSDPKFAMPSVYFYAIWAGIGFNVVMLSGAIGRVPVEVMESARLDGVGLMRELFQIVTPIIWPTISTLFVFGAMTVFTQFMQPMILTPNGLGDTWTIAYLVVSKVQGGVDLYYSAALGLLFTAVGLPVVMGVKKLIENIFDVVET
jgi:ABC transporter, permease protein